MTESAKTSRIPVRKALLAVGVVGAAAAIATVLVLGNAGPAGACPAQQALGTAIGDAAQGELAALNGTGGGRGYADMAFTDAAGKPMTIADFEGKALLVNFWASWCVPCREEMPGLDALAAKYNSERFEVLPINLDIGEGGIAKARDFLAQGNWPNLPLYTDSSFAAFDRLKTQAVSIGLPTTLVLDAKGCELGVLQGPAKWDTPDGERVVEALLAL